MFKTSIDVDVALTTMVLDNYTHKISACRIYKFRLSSKLPGVNLPQRELQLYIISYMFQLVIT